VYLDFTMTNQPQVKHERDCDDCAAEERGIIIAPDQDNQWYAFFAHDTYGDGYWKGASYQVISGPFPSEAAAMEAVNA
jgi:hypothetical protein